MSKINPILALFIGLVLCTDESSARTLKIATMSYHPFQYEENGEVKGVAVDIIKEIFGRMNQPIEISFYPFPRAMYKIKKGESDVIFTFYFNNERNQYVEYCKEPLINQIITLFVHKDSPISYDGNLSKLNQYKFGLVRFSYGTIFDEAIKNKVISKFEYSSTMESNIKKFIKGRFDILPSDRMVAHYYHSKLSFLEINQFKELIPPVQIFPAYIGFSRANMLTSVRNEVDKTLREMKKDGSHQEILGRSF